MLHRIAVPVASEWCQTRSCCFCDGDEQVPGPRQVEPEGRYFGHRECTPLHRALEVAGPGLGGGQVAVLRLHAAVSWPRNKDTIYLGRGVRLRRKADFHHPDDRSFLVVANFGEQPFSVGNPGVPCLSTSARRSGGGQLWHPQLGLASGSCWQLPGTTRQVGRCVDEHQADGRNP
jgi:hypothetical protein